jgi:hypothetical protein
MMEKALPEIYLARHGETEWSMTGQHTGRTDIPLTARGERNALSLGERLNGMAFAKVLVSPRSRKNGITAGMRADAPPTSARSSPIGICSATAVPAGSRSKPSAAVPTGSSPDYERSMTASWSAAMAICCASWQRAG